MSVESSTIEAPTRIKAILLGDQAVGKSAIIERFVHNKYEEANYPTVGIDFFMKRIITNNRTYKLHLWDTAGQERYRSLIPSYVKDANCAILVFDLSKRDTFESVASWVNMCKENSREDMKIVLVGNKLDLEKTVERSEAEMVVQRLGLGGYMEVSAKSGVGLQELFVMAVDKISSEEGSEGTVAVNPSVPTKRETPIVINKPVPGQGQPLKRCC